MRKQFDHGTDRALIAEPAERIAGGQDDLLIRLKQRAQKRLNGTGVADLAKRICRAGANDFFLMLKTFEERLDSLRIAGAREGFDGANAKMKRRVASEARQRIDRDGAITNRGIKFAEGNSPERSFEV